MSQRWYVTNSIVSNSLHALYGVSYGMVSTEPGATGTESAVSIAGSAANYPAFIFYTPADQPGSADWPDATTDRPVRLSTDVSQAGADLTYSPASSSGGHAARVDGGLTSHLESGDYTSGATQTGTGIKVWDWSTWNFGTGSASDRCEVVLGCDNNSMKAETLGLYYDDRDTFVQGPWTWPTDITQVDTRTARQDAGNSVSFDPSWFSPAYEAGDLMVVFVGCSELNSLGGYASGGSGWTYQGRSVNPTSAVWVECWTKQATASESAATWALSGANTGNHIITGVLYRTATSGETVQPVASSLVTDGAASVRDCPVPQLTSQAGDVDVWALFAKTTLTNQSFVPPIGMDEIADYNYGTANNYTVLETESQPTGPQTMPFTGNQKASLYQNNTFTYARSIGLVLRTQAGGGGTQTPQSVSGALTFGTVSLVRQTGKKPAGGLTFSGSIARRLSLHKALAGALTFAGSARKQARRALAGTLSFVGSRSATKVAMKALSGTVTFLGVTQRQTRRGLAGVLTFAGDIVKRVPKVFAGALTLAGALPRTVYRTLVSGPAALTFSGWWEGIKQTGQKTKELFGALTFAASRPIMRVSKSTSGVVSFTVSLRRRSMRALSGALTFSVTMVKRTDRVLAVGLSFGAQLTRQTRRTLVGAVTFGAGLTRRTAQVISAALTFSGIIDAAKQTAQKFKDLAGSLTFAGSIVRRPGKTLIGSVSFAPTVVRRVARSLSGALTFSGTIDRLKSALKALSAALTFSGSMTRRPAKSLAGTLPFAGTLPRRVGRQVAGSLTFVGATVRRTARSLTASLDLGGWIDAVKNAGPQIFPKLVEGALTFGTGLSRTATRTLVPTAVRLTFSGGVTASRLFARALSGILSFVGSTSTRKMFLRTLSGAVSFAGGVGKRTARGLAAAQTFSGSISRRSSRVLPGTLAFAGAVRRRTSRVLSGTISFAADVARQFTSGAEVIYKSVSGVLTFSGDVVRRTGRQFAGTLPFAGVVQRSTRRALIGAITFAGIVSRASRRTLIASLDFSTQLTRAVSRRLVATLSFTTSFIKRLPGAIINAIGTITEAGINLLGSIRRRERQSTITGETPTGRVSGNDTTGEIR